MSVARKLHTCWSEVVRAHKIVTWPSEIVWLTCEFPEWLVCSLKSWRLPTRASNIHDFSRQGFGFWHQNLYITYYMDPARDWCRTDSEGYKWQWNHILTDIKKKGSSQGHKKVIELWRWRRPLAWLNSAAPAGLGLVDRRPERLQLFSVS